MVEDFRAPQGAFRPPARAGDSRQVEEAVGNPRLVQAARLFDDVPGPVALVHEGQGFLIPGLHAHGEAVIAQVPEAAKLLTALESHVRHPGKAADALHRGKVPPDKPGDFLQTPRQQHERIRPHQKDPPGPLGPGEALEPGGEPGHGVRAPELGLLEVRLDFLQRGHAEAEGQVLVQGAELAGVVGAARRGLEQQGVRLVGRPPDGSMKVHGFNSSRFCSCRHPNPKRPPLQVRNFFVVSTLFRTNGRRSPWRETSSSRRT